MEKSIQTLNVRAKSSITSTIICCIGVSLVNNDVDFDGNYIFPVLS
jgi:hypothetical protein